MGNELYLILAVIVAGFTALFFFLKKTLLEMGETKKPSDELLEWLKSTSDRLDQQNKNFLGALQSNTKSLNERLDNAARVIGKVQKNIGEMSEIGRGMKDLQEFLRSPKLRGNIGEQVLKELLGQMLPKQSFHLQYSFKSGPLLMPLLKPQLALSQLTPNFPWKTFAR